MDHLGELLLGNKIGRLPFTDYYSKLNDCLSKTNGQPLGYDGFVAFPQAHGRWITNDYDLEPDLPPNSTPNLDPDLRAAGEHGVGDADLRRTTSNTTGCGCAIAQLEPSDPKVLLYLSQSWLFFHLIRCFLETAEGLATLDHSSFREGGFLRTNKLPEKLHKWTQKIVENHQKEPHDVCMRLVSLGHVLQLAKRFVTRHFGGISGDLCNENSEEDSGGVSIRAEPDASMKEMEQLGLALMVLGETLWTTLQKALSDCNIQSLDWMNEGDEGWGPSPWAISKMIKTNWCPRARRTITGQFGRNATLMSFAVCVNDEDHNYIKHSNTKLARECTQTKCEYVEAAAMSSVHSSADDGSYQYGHTHGHGCRSQRPNTSRSEAICEVIKSPENDILNIISPTSENIKPTFPLLYLEVDGSTRPSTISIQTRPWTENAEYVTVSHVWSQGLGGSNSLMALRACHLHHLLKYLREAAVIAGLTTATGTTESSCFFWLDTLAIPEPLDKPETPEEKEMQPKRVASKAKAMSLIHLVYQKASSCIILERGLASLDTTATHQTIAMRLISGAWMSRLWTLQEAYVSRSLLVVLPNRIDSDPQVIRLDDLWTEQDDLEPGKGFLKSLLIGMLKRAVTRNTMTDIKPGSLPISHAWRAARYRDLQATQLETQVLASLLDVPILPSSDQTVTASQRSQDQTDSSGREAFSEETVKIWRARVKLMKEFWEKISEQNNLVDQGNVVPVGMMPDSSSDTSADEYYTPPESCCSETDEDASEDQNLNFSSETSNSTPPTANDSNYSPGTGNGMPSDKHLIPAGLIFIPGERLPTAGLRWAPLSWMSFQDEPYPFPLDYHQHPAKLLLDDDRRKGLLVKFPGFRLDASRSKLEKIVSSKETFEFPVGKDLNEWYRVQSFEDGPCATDSGDTQAQSTDSEYVQYAANLLKSRIVRKEAPVVGIILSRPRPGESPAEIGLLVEIAETEAKPGQEILDWIGDLKAGPVLFCNLIRRVEVSRVMVDANKSSKGSRPATSLPDEHGNSTHDHTDNSIIGRFTKFLDNSIIGKSYKDAQVWCVDGYEGLEPVAVGADTRLEPLDARDDGSAASTQRGWIHKYASPLSGIAGIGSFFGRQVSNTTPAIDNEKTVAEDVQKSVGKGTTEPQPLSTRRSQTMAVPGEVTPRRSSELETEDPKSIYRRAARTLTFSL